MNTDVRLGRVAGIEIGFNWSFLLIFALIAWTLAESVLPAQVPGQPVPLYWFVGGCVAVVFFACLLGHELAHAILARRLGEKIEGITLWLFGGVSKISGEPRSAGVEAAIAGVGPLASFVIAIVMVGLAIGLSAAGLPDLLTAGLYWLAVINVALGVFNLLPGFPLDGGRLLRAALWRWSGNRVTATSRAATAGRVMGLVLIALGVLEFVLGRDLVNGLWFVFLGWFLRGAASAEERQVVATDVLAGLRVRDVMTPAPVTLPASMTVQQFLWSDAFPHRFTTFPLTGDDGDVVGVVSLRQVLGVPEEHRAQTTLGTLAAGGAGVVKVAPDDPAVEVARRMADSPSGRVLVFEQEQLVGIVSPRDLAQALQVLTARVGGRRPAAPAAPAEQPGR